MKCNVCFKSILRNLYVDSLEIEKIETSTSISYVLNMNIHE